MAQRSLLSLFGGPEGAAFARGRALMILGCASHVGKSWTATAICRYLKRRGVRVAPFKAQNMSNNSQACADGGEIGRAQAAQAEACGVEPRSDMNPVLLKPSAGSVQVIVNGQVWKENVAPREYYEHHAYLSEQVDAAYRRLATQFDFIVAEGAGGAAELNLADRDLANLPLARRFGIPALLVANIDRGGVFASVYGTLRLIDEGDRALIRSFLVNRFRGDMELFADGRQTLEKLAEKPCLGVFPYADDIRLDAEDSLSAPNGKGLARRPDELRIAIIRLPHLSNFTDFNLLPNADYIEAATDYEPDLIILPGTKNTLEDLAWLREAGIDKWILDRRKSGTAVWGVCGGFQMMGRAVEDPEAVESRRRRLPGLGLFPAMTTLEPKKVVREVNAVLELNGTSFKGYEIHLGRMTPTGSAETPFCRIDGQPEGWRKRGLLGTTIHGAFENRTVLRALLVEVAEWRHKVAPGLPEDNKELHYNRLADWFEQHVDRQRFEELYL